MRAIILCGLGLEAGDFDWYQGLHAHWRSEGRSEEEITRLSEAIARNAVVVKGHSLLAQLLASGEIDVAGANYRHIVDRFKEEGAPIAWEPAVEPVFTRAEASRSRAALSILRLRCSSPSGSSPRDSA